MNQAVYTLATLPPPKQGVARYGVIGSPVTHSLSPQMQEAAFHSLAIPAEYLRVEIPASELSSAPSLLVAAGFQGWNCTLPHKQEMFRLLKELDPSAQEGNSVNTVRLESGRLKGYSTDGAGWEAAFHEVWPASYRDLRILLLGCGGVGQALGARLALGGCRSLFLVNRDPSKATLLASQLQEKAKGQFPIRTKEWTQENLVAALRDCDLLLQATSLGLPPSEECPAPLASLHPPLAVFDTIYRQDLPPLVRLARQAGCQAVDGLGMLLHQGALSFEIWTGRKAPLSTMRLALEKAAGRKC